MANKSIDIVISTVLKKTGIDAARTALANLAKTSGKNLMNIKAGFDMAASAVGKFVSMLEKGMAFERMTMRFKALTGSMETAKAHMKDLQDLGRTPPFSLEEFAAASQMMMKMTGGMAGFKREMEIVGDIAAATGNDIATVGRAFGLAYQVIRDGQPFGRAGQQLYMMGVLTKKQVADFDELSKSGASNVEVWQKLSEVFGRYKGAMADTEKSTKGLVEAIQGEATVAVTEFSAALSEEAKPALEGVLGWMRRINEDGTIEEWAASAADAFARVAEGAKTLVGPLSVAWKAVKSTFEATAQAVGNAVGTMAGGGGAVDAVKAVARGAKEGFNDVWDADGAGAAHEESTKEERRKAKAKKRAEESAKIQAEAESRIAEDMARAQKERDQKAAEEKAKADADAAQKAVEAERKAREKMEADLHAQRVKNAEAELKAAQGAAGAKEAAANNAQTEFDRAFAMYRSEDKGAAQIAEERDYAADYKQLKKDAARYGGKWRIDELSSLIAAGDTQGQAAKLEEWRKSSRFTPEVESMVRAAAADDAKTSTMDELRKISANTEGLAKKLDDLLQLK